MSDCNKLLNISINGILSISGKEEITKLLIKNGANTLAKDKFGETAAYLAEKNGTIDEKKTSVC